MSEDRPRPPATDRSGDPVRVLVVTVAHRGDDARIAHRQIGALVRAAIGVIYIAPEPDESLPGVERVVVRRAVGRRRIGAWLAVYRLVRQHRDAADVVLVHDLEAVIPVRLARPGAPIVWDVHEDIASSVGDRGWIPGPLRGVVRAIASLTERVARSGIELILAEESYRDRLGDWPVVPNTTEVPGTVVEVAEGPPRVVYLGRLSRHRGLETMISVGEALRGEVEVALIGPVDGDLLERLEAAVEAGSLRWEGPMSNPDALDAIGGAVAGLCFLDPIQNYVGSMPTKIYEYFSRGVPAIVSGPPLAVNAVEVSGGGVAVEPDVEAICGAIRAYVEQPTTRRADGAAGHAWVVAHHDWTTDGRRFAEHLRAIGNAWR